MKLPIVSTLGAVLLLVAGAHTAPAQDLGLDVGTLAPNPTVYTLDGARTTLSAYIGKTPTLIEFWATWCPNCKELRPAMKAASVKYGGKVRFVDIAVSVNENPQRVKAFVAKYGIPGDQFFDTNGDATDKFAVPATSYVVVLDRTGKIVYTGLGGSQDLDTAIKKAL